MAKNSLIPYADPGTKLTDRQLSQLERQIGRVYAGATRDVEKSIQKYWANLEKRDNEMRKQYNDGKITKEHYKQWRLNQIGRGQRMEALRDELAERIFKVNDVANSYINDKTPGIYSLNWNYSAYTIENIHPGAAMTIYDEQTVKRLVMKDPNLMPHYPQHRALKRGIDLAYSKKVITNAITKGILTGKTLPDIATELRGTIIGMGRTSSMRAARTAFTGAQNGGRLACMESAQARGIDVQKQWLSARDARVRDSHVFANGEIKPINKKFSNGLMYPGDRDGRPAEVYNCRCTLLYVVDGKSVLDKNPPALDNTNNFLEWEKQHEIVKPSVLDILLKNAKGTKNNFNEMDAFAKAFDKATSKIRKALNKNKVIVELGRTGSSGYDIFNKTIFMAKGADEIQAHHEIGHAIESFLIDKKELDILKEKMFKDVKQKDVYPAYRHDNNGKKRLVFFVKSDNLISEYQGRIYIRSAREAFDGGRLRTELMLEMISEGYRVYMENPELLKKKNKELYKLIERAIKDD